MRNAIRTVIAGAILFAAASSSLSAVSADPRTLGDTSLSLEDILSVAPAFTFLEERQAMNAAHDQRLFSQRLPK